MRKPDFLIVGAQKSGTTSLYKYMKMHPTVWFPDGVKETHFFTFWNEEGYESESSIVQVKTKVDEYLSLFSDAPGNVVAGEASPSYLYDPEAPKNIRSLLPNISLIAILRDPVDRAFSNYLHAVRSGRESYSFEKALELEKSRISSGEGYMRHYKQKGFYGEQISRYYNYFDRSQIMVVLSRDLWKDTQSTLKDIFNFLGIRESINVGEVERISSSRVPHNLFLKELYKNEYARKVLKKVLPNKLISCLVEKFTYRPSVDKEVRKRLINQYKKDIKLLENTVDKDLSDWKQV